MSMTTTPRLRMTGISKRYGAVRALTDVTFELLPGEVMALLGENGAGKSTLVKMLSGLVRADAGEVCIDGDPVDLASSRRSQEAGVAVVQQEYSSVPCLSVGENLALGQRGTGLWWTRKRLAQRSHELLETVGLGHVTPETRVEQLSVAETQLVEIARVLARDARIVIFDEPTAALSDAEIERVLTVVRRLAEQGRSVVYVTHRLPEVFRIADRVTVLRNGRSLDPLPVAELAVDKVIEMMLGRELEAMYPDRGELDGSVRLAVSDLYGPGLREPVTFTVGKGEILGLTGQLGSGAATVVQALAGRVPVAGGSVEVDGKAVSLQGRAAGIADRIAYCSADRKRDGVFAGISIQRNLSSPWLKRVSSAGVVSRRRERELASRIANEFAVDVRRLRAPVATLSGGNQQKVALGKWLGTDPAVLLVEEPTRGVDVGARAEIYRRLRELCSRGLAVVVASSDTAEIHGLCDTIATFYRGQLTELRPHAEWTEDAIVREVMHEAGEVA